MDRFRVDFLTMSAAARLAWAAAAAALVWGAIAWALLS